MNNYNIAYVMSLYFLNTFIIIPSAMHPTNCVKIHCTARDKLAKKTFLQKRFIMEKFICVTTTVRRPG